MVTGFQVQTFAKTTQNIPWTVGGLSIELIGDALMTGGMTYYLTRGRTGFERYVVRALGQSIINYHVSVPIGRLLFSLPIL